MIEQELQAPIPGESLTEEPNKYPWERPPETVEEEEAIVHHIERLSQESVQDNILDALQMELPVSYITDLVLTGGVIKGIHSIDISLLIAPVVHEFITSIADASGLEYREFFEEDSEDNLELIKSQATEGLGAAINMAEEDDEGVALLRELESSVAETDPTTEDTPVEEIAPEPRGKGLMSREEEVE